MLWTFPKESTLRTRQATSNPVASFCGTATRTRLNRRTHLFNGSSLWNVSSLHNVSLLGSNKMISGRSTYSSPSNSTATRRTQQRCGRCCGVGALVRNAKIFPANGQTVMSMYYTCMTVTHIRQGSSIFHVYVFDTPYVRILVTWESWLWPLIYSLNKIHQ